LYRWVRREVEVMEPGGIQRRARFIEINVFDDHRRALDRCEGCGGINTRSTAIKVNGIDDISRHLRGQRDVNAQDQLNRDAMGLEATGDMQG
jgi:hypothetical protein